MILCAGTVAGKSFTEQLAAARAGGFSETSLFPQVYYRARRSGLTDAAMRALLADHDLRVADVEPLLNWVPGHPVPFSRYLPRHLAQESDFYRMAEAVQARALTVAWSGKARLPEQQLVDAFAGLCERAAVQGLQINLEFLPWTQLGDVHTALRIVRQAGQANGGVMFDTWHHYRGASAETALTEIDGQFISAVQISDAPRRPWPLLSLEALVARRLPGEGSIDLATLLRQLKAAGCRVPVGIELFAWRLRRHSAETLGSLAGRSLHSCLQQAGYEPAGENKHV